MNFKYARVERERKFLLSERPDLIKWNKKFIQDKYITNTNLRLRKVTEENEVVYKLGKKENLDSSVQINQKITTIYLTESEYLVFNKLEGYLLSKTRYYKSINEEVIAIDEIKLISEIIYLAEVEFNTEEEMLRYQLPFLYIKEITEDIKYTGVELAKRS